MTKPEAKKTITAKVDICNLMVQTANECRSPGVTYGTRIALGCLERLTKRACELNDPEMLKELETLGLVTES